MDPTPLKKHAGWEMADVQWAYWSSSLVCECGYCQLWFATLNPQTSRVFLRLPAWQLQYSFYCEYVFNCSGRVHDLKPKFDLNTDLFNVIFGGGVLKNTSCKNESNVVCMEKQLIGLFLCSLNEPGLRQQQCYEALLPHSVQATCSFPTFPKQQAEDEINHPG